MFELLAIEPEVASGRGSIVPRDVRWDIEFRNVTFAYESGREVLRDVSFRVEPGESVALFGPTGAGKTTVTRLVHRFYDPTAGAVLIGGHDLRQVDEILFLDLDQPQAPRRIFVEQRLDERRLAGAARAGEEHVVRRFSVDELARVLLHALDLLVNAAQIGKLDPVHVTYGL